MNNYEYEFEDNDEFEIYEDNDEFEIYEDNDEFEIYEDNDEFEIYEDNDEFEIYEDNDGYEIFDIAENIMYWVRTYAEIFEEYESATWNQENEMFIIQREEEEEEEEDDELTAFLDSVIIEDNTEMVFLDNHYSINEL